MASSSHLIRLQNGHTIEYETYGHPDGFPVFFFHGFLGTSHQASLLDKKAYKHTIRIIALNRTGIQSSSFASYKTALDATQDIASLIRHMNISSCGVLGFSSGAIFALALAHLLPTTIQNVALIGPIAPVDDRGNFSHLKTFHIFILTLVRKIPLACVYILHIYSWLYCHLPSVFERHLVRFMTTVDETILRNRLPRRLLEIDLKTIFCKSANPGKGIVQELLLLSNWGFDLPHMPPHIPVSIWHGKQDTVLPYVFSKYLSNSLPNAKLHLLQGGHLAPLGKSDEILKIFNHKKEHK